MYTKVEYDNKILFSDLESIDVVSRASEILKTRFYKIKNAYDATNEEYWKWYLRCRTNNWKKMHRYPMKRNNGKKKGLVKY